MIWRVCSFFLCLLVGGAVGWWLARDPGAVVGVALGATAWFLLDLVRGLRVLRLLRRDQLVGAAEPGGLWGEAVVRMRRLLRNREQQGQENHNRLQDFLAAIQESPNGVVLLDEQGQIEWCNQTAARHFGFDPERDLLQLIGNLVRDPVFAAYYANPGSAREVVIAGREHSPSRPVRLAVHLHGYGAGRRMLLSRDVTAVEQAEAMRRDFVANVSHEIRTPLTVLAGFVETLQNLPLDAEERSRYLALMATQSHRMQTLVSDLLTLSRLEGSPPPGTHDWVRVQSLLAQCETDARALSALLVQPLHQITFEQGPASELAGIQAELLSAMANLVSNAIRYTPAGGAVHVRWAALVDGRHEFVVRGTRPRHGPPPKKRRAQPG